MSERQDEHAAPPATENPVDTAHEGTQPAGSDTTIVPSPPAEPPSAGPLMPEITTPEAATADAAAPEIAAPTEVMDDSSSMAGVPMEDTQHYDAPAPSAAGAEPPDLAYATPPSQPLYPTGPYAMPPGPPPAGAYPPYAGAYPYPLPPGAGYPTYPGYSGYPVIPGYSGYPPQPMIPGAASLPSMPGYAQSVYPPPGYPPTAGYNTTPLPGYGQPPAAPYSIPLPAYPGYPSMPLPSGERFATSSGPRMSLSALLTALARPFPRWMTVLLCLGAVVVMTCGYLAVVLFGGEADWADGAQTAGIVALVLGGGALLLLLLRLAGGQHLRSVILLSLLAVLALSGAGAAGLLASPAIHRAQAAHEEQSGRWEIAVREYSLAGESGVGAMDIARVYDEWGEQLLQTGEYHEAAGEFQTVLSTYTQTATYYRRAQDDLFATYSAWIRNAPTGAPYQDAITYIEGYRAVPQCDANCESQIYSIDAQAHFQYGQLLANQGEYQGAVTQFEIVQSQFPNSPYRQQAHYAAAQAYWSLAQQEIGNDCPLAASAYQTLSKQYRDTPEGAQAAAALSAPVSVSGTLVNFPTNPLPTVYLSKRAYAPHSTNAAPGSFYFSQDFAASVDPATGDFTFDSIKPGKYAISAVVIYSNGGYNVSWWFWGSGNSLFFQVTPVCTDNLGSLDDSLQK